MKRSKKIQLALISTIPFALTACESTDPVKPVTATKTFGSMKECVDAKVPTDVCSNSYMQALNEHKRIAPMYDKESDCENDFLVGFCNETSDAKWMPRLTGFQITASGQVPVSQLQGQAQTGADGTTIINNGSSGGTGDFLTGLLIGNMLSGGGSPRYHSEPVYTSRSTRGDFQKSTINDRVKAGSTFNSSVQSKKGFDYKKQSITKALSNRSAQTARSKPASSYKSSSRGGFGSQSSARSGFGGS